jgi:hypothetical protein
MRRAFADIEVMPVSDLGNLVDAFFFKIEGIPAAPRFESRGGNILFTQYDIWFTLTTPSGTLACKMDTSYNGHIYQLLFNDLRAAVATQQPVLVAGAYDAAKEKLNTAYVRIEKKVYYDGNLWTDITRNETTDA